MVLVLLLYYLSLFRYADVGVWQMLLRYDVMTSSAKLEIHNLLYCCQRRTEPRPRVTCTENIMKKFGHVFYAS